MQAKPYKTQKNEIYKPNKHADIRTAHNIVCITAHNCRKQHIMKQFW